MRKYFNDNSYSKGWGKRRPCRCLDKNSEKSYAVTSSVSNLAPSPVILLDLYNAHFRDGKRNKRRTNNLRTHNPNREGN